MPSGRHRECARERPGGSPVPGGVPRHAAEGQDSTPRLLTRRNERIMTAAALPARIGRAGRKPGYEQLRTWVVGQSVRNALQAFHGRWAFDPDNPGSGEGFISDGQMRALNITIRRAVHEALRQVDKARNVAAQPSAGSCTPRSRKRWTSASSSSGRSVTTWSRRARPSWKRPTSATSANRTSTGEPGTRRERRVGRGCRHRSCPVQGRRRHPQAPHPDRKDRSTNQAPRPRQLPDLPPELPLSNRQPRELGGVMLHSTAHTPAVISSPFWSVSDVALRAF